jgi:ribosomal protein S18 acetylase RimI-like enzyme
MIQIRSMTVSDVDAVMTVVEAANDALERRAGHEPESMPTWARELFRQRTARFVDRDPGGSWVAVDDAAVVGMVQAIRRGGFWGLSMFYVDPKSQNRGLGRRLLEAALSYARGAELRMIMSSPDPRALRLYSLAGLAIHPAVEVEGEIDRSAVPTGLPGRPGDAADLGLVTQVDADLRGSRAEDVEFLLRAGARMEVVAAGANRGYVVFQGDRLRMLGATNSTAATQLLWRYLAEAGPKAQFGGLTAGQDWAVKVALAARLRVVPAGPLFMGGRKHPPIPWIASGWYF